MYVDKEADFTVYETVEELIEAGVCLVYECGNSYYVRITPPGRWYNCIWIVNKETREVTSMYYTDFLVTLSDKSREISVEEFLIWLKS